ncbi:hypothetical protein FRC17_006293 [Serendipita sp. 399]|nr:hypothetical protein FRC17_006293 [Serendipita sp. 399]
MDRIYVSDYPEALRVASGTSDINKVIVANDGQHQVATLVPANPAVTTGSSYEAQTVGLHAECESVIGTCDISFDNEAISGSRVFNCFPNGYPQVEGGFNKLQPKSELFTQFTDHRPWFRRGLSYNGTDTNPYTFWFYGSMHTESQPAEGERNQVWVQDPDTQISYSMLMCKATVVDATVQYTAISDSYSITSSVPSANNATIRAVTAVLNIGQSPIDAFVSVMQPIALSVRTGEEFVRSFEMQFAKMSLPFAQVAFEPIPAIRSNLVETVRGSSIPTPWLLAYVGMLSLFGFFALLQGSLALRVDKTSVWRPNEEKDGKRRRRLVGLSHIPSSSDSSSGGVWVNITQLAAERLTAPTALVFEALERQSGDPDSQIRSLQPDGLEMFRESRRGGEPSCTVGVGFRHEGLEVEKRDNPFGLVTITPGNDTLDPSQSPIASDEEIGRAI